MPVGIVLQLIAAVQYHLYTAMLFTWTDYKTIFFPYLLKCCLWVWVHQLLCNVSNQARSHDEDKLNHPWRPLPSGRISESEAVALRWAVVAACVTLSSMYNPDLVRTTLGLVAVTFTYDELGGAGNVIGKALCTAGGYISFELGATTIIGVLDFISVTSIIISGILIFTAIQAQDFPDVEGDKAVGRMTFPIYAPELSRIVTLFATSAWSVFLCWFWEIGPISTALFTSFGLHVGLRYYCWRTIEADKKSYLIFNVWLMAAHVLPLHARTSVLAF
ncbi:UbiA prenyltransferase family [Russula aff. rugulosa BPL654]|nr:UbiA prenyltransferase family [Russula aff. rugulosa BPL654]